VRIPVRIATVDVAAGQPESGAPSHAPQQLRGMTSLVPSLSGSLPSLMTSMLESLESGADVLAVVGIVDGQPLLAGQDRGG